MTVQGLTVATVCLLLASCSATQQIASKPVVLKKASIVTAVPSNVRMNTSRALPAPPPIARNNVRQPMLLPPAVNRNPISRSVPVSALPPAPKPRLNNVARANPAPVKAKKGPTPAERAAALPKAGKALSTTSRQAASFAAVEIGGALASVLRARRQAINGGTRHTLQIRLLDGSDHLVIIQQDPEGQMKLTSQKQTSA